MGPPNLRNTKSVTQTTSNGTSPSDEEQDLRMEEIGAVDAAIVVYVGVLVDVAEPHDHEVR